MFFAPPQVKSLSRYSEFGVHLQDKDFLIMLVAAVVLHAVVIAIMLLSPQEEVIRIPVRVLNVKLGDIDTHVNPSDMPQLTEPVVPAPAPAESNLLPQQIPALSTHREATSPPPTAEVASNEKAKAKLVNPATEKVWLPEKSTKKMSHHKSAEDEQKLAEGDLTQPKEYVRDDLAEELAERAAQEGKKSGAKAGGGAGAEAIERYEQAISIWLAQHKIYPESAKEQGIEGDAVVRVRISRKGKILYYGIERSSGSGLIDQAAMAMVKASDPVPAVPEDYPEGSQLEFLIPVTYRLK